MSPAPFEITSLLQRWGQGDPDAFDRLVRFVHDRRRVLPRQHPRGDPAATPDTTGLVDHAAGSRGDPTRVFDLDRLPAGHASSRSPAPSS